MLCYNADSAYTSKATEKYYKDNQINVIILPGVFSDFLILKAIAYLIKRKFYIQRYTTEKTVVARFQHLFEEEISQEAIQEMYD